MDHVRILGYSFSFSVKGRTHMYMTLKRETNVVAKSERIALSMEKKLEWKNVKILM